MVKENTAPLTCRRLLICKKDCLDVLIAIPGFDTMPVEQWLQNSGYSIFLCDSPLGKQQNRPRVRANGLATYVHQSLPRASISVLFQMQNIILRFLKVICTLESASVDKSARQDC